MRRLLFLLLLALPLSAATFESHDGTVLHYDVVGKGETVVLLSGGPGFSPEYLRPVAEKLAGKHRFVLFHQRGTGKSVIETYSAETLKLATLAGHSFGGILAMMYARQHPQRIRALAMIDAGGPTLAAVEKFNANLSSRFTEADNAKIKEWSAPEKMKEDRRRAVLEITKAKSGAYFADPKKAHLLTEPMTIESFHDGVFWAVVMQMMALDLREGLEKVKAPVLVLHGKQDPLETAEEVHAAFPGSKLVVIENAGHFPWLEQEEVFYRALGEFLAGV
jgi:proline iminopeptidase